MHLYLFQLISLGVLAAFAAASNYAAAFCKCTCFEDSVVVPLSPEKISPSAFSSSTSTSSPSFSVAKSVSGFTPSAIANLAFSQTSFPRRVAPRYPAASCSQCTKIFCLSNGISICDSATEEDVQAICLPHDFGNGLTNDQKAWLVFSILLFVMFSWVAFMRYKMWVEDRPGRGVMEGLQRRLRRHHRHGQPSARGEQATLNTVEAYEMT